MFDRLILGRVPQRCEFKRSCCNVVSLPEQRRRGAPICSEHLSEYWRAKLLAQAEPAERARLTAAARQRIMEVHDNTSQEGDG